jgi:fibronectin-binding autotransporter adhesin
MRQLQLQGWSGLRVLLDLHLLLPAVGLVLMMAGMTAPASASWEWQAHSASLGAATGGGMARLGWADILDGRSLDVAGAHRIQAGRAARVRLAHADTDTLNDASCGSTNNGNGVGGHDRDCGGTDTGGGSLGDNCDNTNNGNGAGGHDRDCGGTDTAGGSVGDNCDNSNNGNGAGGHDRDCGGMDTGGGSVGDNCDNTNNGNGAGGHDRGCGQEVKDVQPGERFDGSGVIGPITNAGVVAPGGDAIDTLTVDGSYTGMGGTLEIDGVLGGDTSPTDQLIVTGDTDGTTNVKVTNRGGLGALTAQGIKIIDVQGASNGTFTLSGDYKFQSDPAVIAGAYGYRLQEADGDWYLRSTYLDSEGHVRPIYQPGVPLYEAYPQVLQALNGLPTMQQRVGNRYWGDETAKGFLSGAHPHSALWARVEGSRTSLQSEHSTAGVQSDAGRITAQAGLDGLFSETGEGRMIGGLTVHYGAVAADIGSIYGRGDITAKGYGFGGTLTWLGWDGFYVDGQAQVTWFDGKLDSDTLGRIMAKNNNGFGYGLGVELGKRVDLGGAWGLVPQAQLIYSAVDFDGFTDPFGAKVRLGDGDALTGRLGLATEYRESWKDALGIVSRASFYGIANLYYAFDGKTGVDVSNATFVSSTDKLWGGVGAGGTYGWSDQVALFAEATVNTSLANFGDSYSYKGTAGLRLTW